MIVVTGATGQLGRLIVEGLLASQPAATLGLSVRDPEHAADLQQKGLRVRRGDFADPDTLAHAFEGAEQVLLISVNKFGPEAVHLHSNAIEAARAAGVKRVFYTSHQAASASSAFIPCQDHAATEALLAASGLPWVSLRNGFYAESALFQLGGMRETGKIALPTDGPVSWTAREDLAHAAVAALTQPALFDGISPPLTGSQTLDFADIARISSELLGREISRDTVSDSAYRESLLAQGLPAAIAEGLGSLYTASRGGEFAVVDSTLAKLLGKPPVPMRQVLHRYLHTATQDAAH